MRIQMPTRGVLLAAGASVRFGHRKLMHQLPCGMPIGVAAARNLLRGCGSALAVVRACDHDLAALLRAEGLEVVVAERASSGMGASLAAGVLAAPDANGWLIALADMPWLAPDTIRALVSMLNDGATLAAPGYDGRRGHPVGFGRAFQDELINLTGDTGARELLRSNASQLQLLPCDDAGVLMDVDTPADLSATRVWD
ncbi:MAG: nucleotidyltransferase family protein [Gammaproteobacteria bacterium]|nr:nucleotidyltransferase family protein [Gammaproteobacteria bacterium]